MQFDEQRIAAIVARVLENMEIPKHNPATEVQPMMFYGDHGIFRDIDVAIKAAKKAQEELAVLSLKQRGKIVDVIRRASIDNVEIIAKLAHEETGYGRIPDKIQKKLNAARLTPGIEDIKVDAKTGDGGLVLIERAPVGVIAAIEPATHPGSCVINHAISMVAAGNSVIFLPHPKGIRTTMEIVRIYNQAISVVGGPNNLLVVGDQVSMELFDKVITHPQVDLVVATGGPEVVRKALSSGKKAIAAGPGNPPVLVDETVDDLAYVAQCIVNGASFDNTVLCIAEKVIIAVGSIADELLLHMEGNGAYYVREEEVVVNLTRVIIPDGESFCPDLIGKNASVILDKVGVKAPEATRLVVFEAQSNHPLVMKEQLLPVVPVVRVHDFEEGMNLAATVEQGFKHTAVIHSKDVTRITRYAQRLRVDILVANAASGAGLAVGAEGHYSHTIASPTGEGICTPRTYTREQRTVLAGALYTV